jgi:hypothetical protein
MASAPTCDSLSALIFGLSQLVFACHFGCSLVRGGHQLDHDCTILPPLLPTRYEGVRYRGSDDRGCSFECAGGFEQQCSGIRASGTPQNHRSALAGRTAHMPVDSGRILQAADCGSVWEIGRRGESDTGSCETNRSRTPPEFQARVGAMREALPRMPMTCPHPKTAVCTPHRTWRD